jgi:hypothetical protein
LGRVRDSK